MALAVVAVVVVAALLAVVAVVVVAALLAVAARLLLPVLVLPLVVLLRQFRQLVRLLPQLLDKLD